MPRLEGPLPWDKGVHFLLYAVAGALTGWGWRRAGRLPHWTWPALAPILLGALDEFRQTRVPGRHGDWADWAADAAGALLAFAWMAVRAGRPKGGTGG